MRDSLSAAPRSLNEPVACSDSSLSQQLSGGANTSGVVRTKSNDGGRVGRSFDESVPEALEPRHPHDRLRRVDGDALVERGQLGHLLAPREQAEAGRAALDDGPRVEIGALDERGAVARAGAAAAAAGGARPGCGGTVRAMPLASPCHQSTQMPRQAPHSQ